MRSAIIISVVLHALVSIIAFEWVSFREVKYVPRQVYRVRLVEPSVAQPPPPKKEKAPEVTPPAPEPEPKVEEKKPDQEMPPPPRRPKKPKPKPEPAKPKPREVPKTDIEPPTPRQEETAEGEQPQTGDVSLDSEDFPFAPYINRIRRKIAAQWRVPEGSQGAERQCRVYFRVHRDGSVSSVSVEESSNLFMFDQAAMRAVMQAAPLPPLPREYRDAYLGVHFSFVYREKS